MHKLTVKILIVESQFKKILTDDLFNIFFTFFLFFTFYFYRLALDQSFWDPNTYMKNCSPDLMRQMLQLLVKSQGHWLVLLNQTNLDYQAIHRRLKHLNLAPKTRQVFPIIFHKRLIILTTQLIRTNQHQKIQLISQAFLH